MQTTETGSQPRAPRSAVAPVPDRVLCKSVGLPLRQGQCFRLFADPALLESWLCPKARVEPRPGGRYEMFWAPEDPGNDSTIGCRLTAFEPDRLLAFQWRSPRQFKAFANAADPLTHVVVTFHGDVEATVVTLIHSGWRDTPEWSEAAAWQDIAWDHALRALQARARTGVA